MGFHSTDCLHCGHPMLDRRASDEGLNDWMSEYVTLTSGAVARGTWDGDGSGDGGGEHTAFLVTPRTVTVHYACWEHAGKPGIETYKESNQSTANQGWFFNDGDHDMVDPRITDEGERARLLREGTARRRNRRYDEQARWVIEHLSPNALKYREGPVDYTVRWDLNEYHGRSDPEGGSIIANDNMVGDYTEHEGKPMAEVEALYAAKWAEFVESEVPTLMARAIEIRTEARAKHFAELKVEGRYETSYTSAQGDTVTHEGRQAWTGNRTIHVVRDKMLYRIVVVCDGPNERLGRETYVDKYPEDRIEAMRASARESATEAEAEATRLNEQWAADGYPWSWGDEDEVEA